MNKIKQSKISLRNKSINKHFRLVNSFHPETMGTSDIFEKMLFIFLNKNVFIYNTIF